MVMMSFWLFFGDPSLPQWNPSLQVALANQKIPGRQSAFGLFGAAGLGRQLPSDPALLFRACICMCMLACYMLCKKKKILWIDFFLVVAVEVEPPPVEDSGCFAKRRETESTDC